MVTFNPKTQSSRHQMSTVKASTIPRSLACCHRPGRSAVSSFWLEVVLQHATATTTRRRSAASKSAAAPRLSPAKVNRSLRLWTQHWVMPKRFCLRPGPNLRRVQTKEPTCRRRDLATATTQRPRLASRCASITSKPDLINISPMRLQPRPDPSKARCHCQWVHHCLGQMVAWSP